MFCCKWQVDQRANRFGSPLQRHLAAGEPPLRHGLQDTVQSTHFPSTDPLADTVCMNKMKPKQYFCSPSATSWKTWLWTSTSRFGEEWLSKSERRTLFFWWWWFYHGFTRPFRCILATDMARHNEILNRFKIIQPVFDFGNKEHKEVVRPQSGWGVHLFLPGSSWWSSSLPLVDEDHGEGKRHLQRGQADGCGRTLARLSTAGVLQPGLPLFAGIAN